MSLIRNAADQMPIEEDFRITMLSSGQMFLASGETRRRVFDALGGTRET